MSRFYRIYRGNTVPFEVDLQLDNEPYAIPAGATVKAGFRKNGAAVGGPWICSNAFPGADWDAGHVTLQLSAANTTALTAQLGMALEIEVDDAGKKLTWVSDPLINIDTPSI